MSLVTLMPAATSAAFAVAVLVCDAWHARRAAVVVASLGSLLAGVVAFAGPASAGGSLLAAIDLRGVAGLALGALGALALAGGSRRMLAGETGAQEAALGVFSVGASLLAVAASDLLTLAIALEAMALAAYGLVALGDTDRAREAAMKYFVQGAVATGLLAIALGVAFVAGGGTLDYTSLLGGSGSFPRSAALLAWALLVCVLAFKAGAFPFHSWAPDAYETATPHGAALLAAVPKAAVLVASTVLLTEALPAGGFRAPAGLIAALATAGIVFGNIAALRQTSFTRMLGYSGIAQVGYAFVGLAAGRGAGTVVFALVYALAACGAFLAAGAVREADPSWDGTIAGLAGLSQRRPALAAAIAALMLSLTGIPLFGGFLGKLLVFAGAAGDWTWLVIVGVLGSVVSFGYYGSVVRAAYLLEGDGATDGGSRTGPATIAAVAAALAVVALGLLPLLLSGGRLLVLVAP